MGLDFMHTPLPEINCDSLRLSPDARNRTLASANGQAVTESKAADTTRTINFPVGGQAYKISTG